MTITTNTPSFTSTLIDTEGDRLSIAIQNLTERNVDPAGDVPTLITELDLESGRQVAVPGRYMIEAEDGRTLEVALVYAVPLSGDRFYYKGVYPGSLAAPGEDA